MYRLAGIALDASKRRVVAPNGLEAIEIQAERPAVLPQVRIIGTRRVAIEEVVKRPERPLLRRGFGGTGQGDGTRMARLERQVAEYAAMRCCPRDLRQALVSDGAVGAGEVGVDNDERRPVGPEDVVIAAQIDCRGDFWSQSVQ